MCPKSPQFLWIDKHEYKKAEEALFWFREDYEIVKAELEEIKEEAFILGKLPKVTLWSLFNDITLRTPLIIVFVTKFFTKLCGMDTVNSRCILNNIEIAAARRSKNQNWQKGMIN